ncbi:hypothetical protein ACF3M1_05665 [Luteimonas sp. WGS1318]|uniref:hypothetical protein n=1 Tax=Luteimonas sp. WGS1318 TaxID=3366815 RepID=UPI00372D56B8
MKIARDAAIGRPSSVTMRIPGRRFTQIWPPAYVCIATNTFGLTTRHTSCRPIPTCCPPRGLDRRGGLATPPHRWIKTATTINASTSLRPGEARDPQTAVALHRAAMAPAPAAP